MKFVLTSILIFSSALLSIAEPSAAPKTETAAKPQLAKTEAKAKPSSPDAPAATNSAAEIKKGEPFEESETNAISTKPSEDHVELIDQAHMTNHISNLQTKPELNKFQLALEAGRKFREEREYNRAEVQLIQILEGRFPEEIKRPALLELGLVMQDQHSFSKSQHLYAEYVRRYPKDPRVPEVLLRQAYLYRDMGLPDLALSKFFGVMSACLNLKLDEMDYYQKLVLRAQAEIAETYYLQGKFDEASDYYTRLLHLDNPDLDRADILYKLARCYSGVNKFNEAAANARLYISKYPDDVDAPEMRFLLAKALKKMGQNKEALQEMNLLLTNQHARSKTDPQQWLYWQQRAGNDIANELYHEGDYMSALQIYQALAGLNSSAEWQVPVWYQIGLVYENLKQGQKAIEFYDKILNRGKESAEPGKTADAKTSAPSPAVQAVAEMAAWRKKFLVWEVDARAVNQQIQPLESDLLKPSPL
jgi:tetratricopeptide (TPR) repeat protein